MNLFDLLGIDNPEMFVPVFVAVLVIEIILVVLIFRLIRSAKHRKQERELRQKRLQRLKEIQAAKAQREAEEHAVRKRQEVEERAAREQEEVEKASEQAETEVIVKVVEEVMAEKEAAEKTEAEKAMAEIEGLITKECQEAEEKAARERQEAAEKAAKEQQAAEEKVVKAQKEAEAAEAKAAEEKALQETEAKAALAQQKAEEKVAREQQAAEEKAVKEQQEAEEKAAEAKKNESKEEEPAKVQQEEHTTEPVQVVEPEQAQQKADEKATEKTSPEKAAEGVEKEEPEGKKAEKEVVIDVRDVTMTFRTVNNRTSGIKDYMIQKAKGQIHHRDFTALKNISFQVYKGEVVGIIGTNGSGKSTILKIVSGALRPTSGNVIVNHRKLQLLTLGTGFDGELTARENVYLNGSIIGYTKEFIDQHFDEIVEFAELQDFMDEKVKNFSSGMVSRLGFAIATVGEAAEILILDEVLSVGDEFFRKKSLARVKEMIHGGSTVLLVSHSMPTIKENCDRVIWIEKGDLRMVGKPEVVCNAYHRMNEIRSQK